MCPVRAYQDWKVYRGTTPGSFFIKVDKYDRVYIQNPLRYPAFKSRFEKDLQDAGYAKWYLYDKYSFRKGGCQYWCFYVDPKWDIGQLCLWGGWSKEFDTKAIIQYMNGLSDEYHRNLLTKPRKRQKIDV